MSAILRFITVIQKALIFISIICFIPTSVFVFAPSSPTFTSTQLTYYSLAYQQIYSPFLAVLNSNNCTYNEAILNNTHCFTRATNFNVRTEGTTQTCTGYSYAYNGLQFCSGITNGNILNYVNVSGSTFSHSDTVYPLFSISPPLDDPILVYFHYVPESAQSVCKALAVQLTSDVSNLIINVHLEPNQAASRVLWYSILPTLAILVGLIIINQISNKFNFRKYIVMAGFCLNVALIALIIKGISDYSTLYRIKIQLLLFSACFIQEEATVLSEMAGFDFGVGFGFVFFMGIVALLIFLTLVGQLIGKILEFKYYKARTQPSDDYQLEEVKTSVRSRRILNRLSSQDRQNQAQTEPLI